MARHSLFPNSITINYTSNGHAHKQVLPISAVRFDDPGWSLLQRDGTYIEWTAGVDAYVVLLADLLDTSSSIDSAELFDYEATESPAIFLDAYEIGEPGTDIGTASEWDQVVMPFKATGGTSLRLTIMEGTIPPDLRETLGGTTIPQFAALAGFILGDDDWIITRGGTFPQISLGFTSKENDKLRERYFLD